MSKLKVDGIILLAITFFLLTMQVTASGGEPMEGSRLEQFEKEEAPLFDKFADMDYCLFLETVLDYGVSYDYYRYGIYGDFVRTEQEGEELYFDLNEKMIGNKLELYTHQEWNYNTEPFIHDISSDLEWVISRQHTDVPTKLYTDKVYYQGQELEQKDGDEWFENILFALQRKEDSETYELMEEEKIKNGEN